MPAVPELARRSRAPLDRGALAPRRRSCCSSLYVGVTWWQLRRHRASTTRRSRPKACWSLSRAIIALAVATAVDRADRRDPRRLDRDVRRESAPLRLLRRGGHRRDRRQRGRARRRGRRRLPREDQAGGGDRALVGSAGRCFPDPRRHAPLLGNRAARPLVPAGRARRPRRLRARGGARAPRPEVEHLERRRPDRCSTASSRARSSSPATAR